MGLARSTYYDEPESQRMGEARLVEQIKTVCAEWPAYGYRRVTAELQGEGRVVNHKKVMRLMKESRLTVRPRRSNDRQQPRRADLPEPRQEHRADELEPALGRRHHLYRDQLAA